MSWYLCFWVVLERGEVKKELFGIVLNILWGYLELILKIDLIF